jgi:putative transcriptional regulator
MLGFGYQSTHRWWMRQMAKQVVIKINQLLKTKGISLRELSRLTDIRHAALSELANKKRQNINFGHVERIAETFNIKDIREIIDIIDAPDR